MIGIDPARINLLPIAEASERAILGLLLLDGMIAMEHCQRLRPEMFSLDSHRRIYRTLSVMIADGISPDYMLVRNELEKRRELDTIGGPGYLASLTEDCLRSQIVHHVDVVIEKWKLRTGMTICDRYQSQFAEQEDADTTLAAMQAEVFDAMHEMVAQDDPLVCAYTVRELEEVMDYEKSAMGDSYGHAQLDEFTFGRQPGEIAVVGARSGVGKTSLLLQAAAASCREGRPFDLFSLEMSRPKILRRLWALESGVSFQKIDRKWLNAMEQMCVRAAALRVGEWPLRIYDDAGMSLNQIAATIRLDVRRNGVTGFGLDYVQICDADGKDSYTRCSNVSRTLTKLAKQEGVHGTLLSQLKKVPQESYGKPPHIGDLRETGQLENDCHIAILLHRGWDEAASAISYDAEIIVPKQRSGSTGAIQARFNPKTLSFE
jgi:replicative DNA helicase